MINYNKIYKYIMVVVFLLFVIIMVTLNFFNPVKKFSSSENRVLEQKPSFTFASLIKGKFTSNYEKYICDQFALRDIWIGVKSDTERILGKKENNNVYLGKDGYLIQKFHAPSTDELNDRIDAINSFCKNNPNINKYIMLVPTSTKILSDKLPLFAHDKDQMKYYNIVKNNVDKNIKFIDVFNTLNDKKNEYIYYKTDHHWTTKGSFYAYKELGKSMNFNCLSENDFTIKNVTNDFFGSLYSKSGFRHIKPDSINLYVPKKSYNTNCSIWYSDSNKVVNSPYSMENINKKDKYTVFFNSNHPLVKINTNIDTEKKLLVIKDSYANCLVPLLMNHYSEIYMVDPRYYKEDIKKLINLNHITDSLILYNLNTFFEDSSITNIDSLDR